MLFVKYRNCSDVNSQGRNKVYFFITVFLPQILIPDHKNVENFNP